MFLSLCPARDEDWPATLLRSRPLRNNTPSARPTTAVSKLPSLTSPQSQYHIAYRQTSTAHHHHHYQPSPTQHASNNVVHVSITPINLIQDIINVSITPSNLIQDTTLTDAFFICHYCSQRRLRIEILIAFRDYGFVDHDVMWRPCQLSPLWQMPSHPPGSQCSCVDYSELHLAPRILPHTAISTTFLPCYACFFH